MKYLPHVLVAIVAAILVWLLFFKETETITPLPDQNVELIKALESRNTISMAIANRYKIMNDSLIGWVKSKAKFSRALVAVTPQTPDHYICMATVATLAEIDSIQQTVIDSLLSLAKPAYASGYRRVLGDTTIGNSVIWNDDLAYSPTEHQFAVEPKDIQFITHSTVMNNIFKGLYFKGSIQIHKSAVPVAGGGLGLEFKSYSFGAEPEVGYQSELGTYLGFSMKYYLLGAE